jgi:hypothetical protein
LSLARVASGQAAPDADGKAPQVSAGREHVRQSTVEPIGAGAIATVKPRFVGLDAAF